MTPEPNDTLETIRLAAAADPDNAALQLNWGKALLDDEKFEPALSTLQHAIVLDPTLAAAHTALGQLYFHLGPPELALAAYERAIALDPHHEESYYGIGILTAVKLRDEAGAVAAFKRGLIQNPDSKLLADCIGDTYARMGWFAEAQALLEEAHRKDATDRYAISLLQILHLHARRYAQVVDFGQRALAVAPSSDPHKMMGYALLHLGQLDEAIAHLSEALTLKPTDYEVRGALAHALNTAGTPVQTQAAAEHYRMAQAQAMQDDAYGQACFEAVSGNVDRAIELLTLGISQGQVTSGWARIDPEFSFIRQDPRFGVLVDDVVPIVN